MHYRHKPYLLMKSSSEIALNPLFWMLFKTAWTGHSALGRGLRNQGATQYKVHLMAPGSDILGIGWRRTSYSMGCPLPIYSRKRMYEDASRLAS